MIGLSAKGYTFVADVGPGKRPFVRYRALSGQEISVAQTAPRGERRVPGERRTGRD